MGYRWLFYYWLLFYGLPELLGSIQLQIIRYHIGRGIVWPAVMFPSVGKFIGGVLILIIIGALVLRSK